MMINKKTSISDCQIIDLNTIDSNGHGFLSTIYGQIDIPFKIERVFFIYGVPQSSLRGGHAHLELFQLVVPTSGAFEIILYDGDSRKRVKLSKPNQALLIPPMIWNDMENFSSGSCCLVLASLPYDERDYIRDKVEFNRLKAQSDLS